MCYGMNCPFESRYSGECLKPYRLPCPAEECEDEEFQEDDADMESDDDSQ